MTGRRYVDDVCMCGQHADDIPACRRRADDVQMTSGRRMSSATRNLQRSLTLVSSAHRPRVIRPSSACRLPVVCTSSARRTHETSVPRLFQVKQQRTALLKMKTLVTSLSLYGSQYNQMGKHISLNDHTTQKSYLSGDLDFIHLCL